MAARRAGGQLPGVLSQKTAGLDKSSLLWGWGRDEGLSAEGSQCSDPTLISPQVSSNVFLSLTGSGRVTLEGLSGDLSSQPSDRGPDTADRLGGPRQRGYIVPLATLFLWFVAV